MVPLNSTRRVLKLLLIDDVADERLLVRETISLANLPFKLYEADGPESAKDFFQSGEHDVRLFPRPALVMLDYNMVGQNGADFLTWLRVNKKHRSIPVIMFTGSCGRREAAECYANGASHFVCKPTNLQRLKEILGALYLSVLHKTPDLIIQLREYLPDPRDTQNHPVPV
jgi:response regulator RpfG family c-di-GMP phosphodiesterase